MTDAAQVQIVNTALALLGNEPVIDLGDDSLQGSGAAYKLMRSLDTARDVILRRHGWLCALTYTALSAEAAEAGNWKYPWLYRLPGDALRTWEIGGVVFGGTEFECWAPRWQTATIDSDLGAVQVIRSRDNVTALNIAYVRRASWGALDIHIADAIAHELAGRCCYSINGDQGKAERLKQAAEAKALMAISVDGTQEGSQEPIAPSIMQGIRNSSR